MTNEEAIEDLQLALSTGNYIFTKSRESLRMAISALSVPEREKGERKHGHWVRMSDLPEDKDDRYKCSQCGNVVHHSNGVNLYTFNSWCGRCGSLNNSLLVGLKTYKAESEVKPNE